MSDTLVDLKLATRAVARDVMAYRRSAADVPWAEGYPAGGDVRACTAYLTWLEPARQSDPFGYYQILVGGTVVGGVGFHRPPEAGIIEVGYGVVPAARGRGVATAALVQILDVAARLGVRQVIGRTTPDNVASQRVMLKAGMEQREADDLFLHYQIDVAQGR
jgi:RimJ/RimL family protein N-acetyltransferase